MALNLNGQLPSGCDDQSLGCLGGQPAARLGLARQQVVYDRDKEGSRLAAAGLRTRHQIPLGEDDWD